MEELSSEQLEQYAPQFDVRRPWYKSFWKVLLLAVIVGIFMVALMFGLLVYAEYQRLNSGQTSIFATGELADPNAGTQDSGFDTKILNYTPTEDDDPYLGAEDASVVIIEFSDFECPFCKAVAPSLKQLVEKYPNDVKLVYRDFPLESLHPNAHTAALAGECADEQGAFWPYHDLMFENQRELSIDSAYIEWADQLGLNTSEFESCLTSERYADEVANDMQAGTLAGVRATPTFFVNGTPYSGALSQPQLEQLVQDRLQQWLKGHSSVLY